MPDFCAVCSLWIGKYTVDPLVDGGMWVENELGEGMMIEEDKLIDFIDKLWGDEF